MSRHSGVPSPSASVSLTLSHSVFTSETEWKLLHKTSLISSLQLLCYDLRRYELALGSRTIFLALDLVLFLWSRPLPCFSGFGLSWAHDQCCVIYIITGLDGPKVSQLFTERDFFGFVAVSFLSSFLHLQIAKHSFTDQCLHQYRMNSVYIGLVWLDLAASHCRSIHCTCFTFIQCIELVLFMAAACLGIDIDITDVILQTTSSVFLPVRSVLLVLLISLITMRLYRILWHAM